MQSFKKGTYFVFHGNLGNSKSIGTNNLIKEFAEIVTSPDDILKKYGIIEKIEENVNIEKNINDEYDIPKEYIEVYRVITKEPIDVNQILKIIKINLKDLMIKLTMLELNGKIKKIAGNRYIRGDD